MCVFRPEENTLIGWLGEICILLKFFVSRTFPKSLLRGAGKGKEINFRLILLSQNAFDQEPNGEH